MLDEIEQEWCDEYDDDDTYPEDCPFGEMYAPGTEICDFLCPIGPCMPMEQYYEMMEAEEYCYRYLDRILLGGWRGALWRFLYWLKSLPLNVWSRLPRLPRVVSCEVCGRQFIDIKGNSTCSYKCLDEWLPF